LTDERRVTLEPPRPEIVREHDDRVRARGAILLRQEEASRGGARADDLEVVGRDQHGEHPLGGGGVAERHHVRRPLRGRQALELSRLVAQLLEQRVAEIVEPAASGRAPDVDERLRVGYPGARPQEQGIPKAEDRRRGGHP
jgi:hypothetical protein